MAQSNPLSLQCQPGPLNLGHQNLLNPNFECLRLDLSEYSFANLYLFRKNHNYSVVSRGDIFISGKTYDGLDFLMPTFDLRKYTSDQINNLLNHCGCIYPLPEDWLSSFNPDLFHSTYVEADSDYVYLTEKIRSYSGRKLSKKRNLVYQFLDDYQPKALRLDAHSQPLAIHLLENWQQNSNTMSIDTDFEACMEAIQFINQLKLTGTVYCIDDEPIGFIIGEALNSHMFQIIFAKANTSYKGSYQYMFQAFAQQLNSQYTWLNWEQDLGHEELKQSKLSYHPEKILKKYRISRKK